MVLHMNDSQLSLILDAHQMRTAAAVFDRLFPPDADFPGAVAAGVLEYIGHTLTGVESHLVEWYRLGMDALNAHTVCQFSQPFDGCTPAQQDMVLRSLERGALEGFLVPPQIPFFELLCRHMREGLFSDPVYGGNRDKSGWRLLRHPGLHFDYSAEEQWARQPADKDGDTRSLADVDFTAQSAAATLPTGFDPHRGTAPPRIDIDVILIGMGGVGGVIAQRLTEAGLVVMALEAGPWRRPAHFLPDELGLGFYARAGLGDKFNRESPTWRTSLTSPTREAVFGYGRMVNGVGGSLTHYGAWMRRFHPHHFAMRSYAESRWGSAAIPSDSTLADWPVRYEELEPYYTEMEYHIGVAGDGDENPFVPRSKPFPLPPLRDSRLTHHFRQAAQAQGLHPYTVPAGQNSQTFAGRPPMPYHPWGVGFGSLHSERWDPTYDCIPQALATGRLDLRTLCRVTRIVCDHTGHVSGVEYLNPNNEIIMQHARTIILCAYTWENIRLMSLSGDNRHPNGLGNQYGQLGRHFMVKTSTVIAAEFEGEVWNRHTGPAAQAVLVDDFLSTDFDSVRNGFLGGGSPGVEMQTLPLRISAELRPPDVPAWGETYKDSLRRWHNKTYIGVQQDSLPYQDNFVDLDPLVRERSALGLPVVRATYHVHANEQRISAYMEDWGEDILKQMGATRTWRAGRFASVGTCHELGGARMGDDPTHTVVDADLQVHDTPGLHVYGGAVFPSCPGINPTHTMLALCLRAADRLIARLRSG
jgi:gluconate 2-dehydrogenase alpha chain